MAEVSWKLQSGVYRLSALRNRQNRSVCRGESVRSLVVKCTRSDSRVKEKSARDPRELQPATKSGATQLTSAKCGRVRKSKSQREDGTLLCATTLELDSFCFICFFKTMRTHKATFHLTERLQPVLQQQLLPQRMTSWTRRAVCFHPVTLRSRQQHRAFCTFILILAEQGLERPGYGQSLRGLKLCPDPSTTYRNYSWRRGNSSADAPLLYRSKTAYYDILKVFPGSTQSQIKTAYYKQSFIYHPDKNPGSKEAMQRFSEISEAYTVLGNISLRRKYDRGILSQFDVQRAGRPSSKETTPSTHTGARQQQHQQRARQFSQTGGKPMFDFDAFYQAHYGEQMQRERDRRAMKERMQEKQKENLAKWKQGKMIELTVAMLLTMAGLCFINIGKP